MMQRIIIVTSLIFSTIAIFAADTDPLLQETKNELINSLYLNVQDETPFKYVGELHAMIGSMKPFETLISQAKTPQECQLIKQKITFVRTLIRNRDVLGEAQPEKLYSEVIPRILALTTVTSHDDKVIKLAGKSAVTYVDH